MFPLRRLVPHSLRAWLIAAAGAVLLLGVAGFLFVWLVVFGTSSPPPLRLSTATPSAQSSPLDSTAIAGRWSVGSGSVVGYRVREQLAFLPAPTDAVGRTSQVTGSATLGGTGDALSVTAASFQADVSTLASDRSMRDQRIHSIGLQSDRYPTATFALTQSLSLPATASTGATISVSITGNLTIHGVTRQVAIPVQAHLSGSEIEVAGSITFPWSQFGMEAPSIGGIVSVTDQATMEFDLHLHRA